MVNRILVASLVLLISASAAAQEKAPTPASEKPTTREVEAAPRPSKGSPGQPTNVKLDFTITDDLMSGEPARRIVTMIVADGQRGSIRSSGNQVQARLFVDATPQILSNGAVRVHIGLQYNPRQAPTEKSPQLAPAPMVPGFEANVVGGSSLNQEITSILQPDKPLVISQASDPVSDRKITVEVRASILKQ